MILAANIQQLVGSGALWVAVLIALVAGLVSFLSPCVLPLVPGYLGFLSGSMTSAGNTRVPRRRLLLGVLLFIAGFTVVFLAMNVLGGAIGLYLLPYRDLIVRVMGLLVIVMGFIFVGFFGFAQRIFRPRSRSTMGLLGAPLLGFALGLGWAPCIGPTLAAILSISFESGSVGRATVLGLAYSAGLGIPFIIIALGFGWATRSLGVIRRHIRLINIIGGVLLIILGVLMATGLWSAWMSQLQGVIAGVTPVI